MSERTLIVAVGFKIALEPPKKRAALRCAALRCEPLLLDAELSNAACEQK